MKTFVVWLTIFASLGQRISAQNDAVITKWIEQKLDNFDENLTTTWRMRYMENPKYYQSGGPLFIYVGAESAIDPIDITVGRIVELAEEFNAYLILAEHRYYGESRPTANTSVENLKYLSSQQALADIANLVRTLKSIIPGAQRSKVIMLGTAYGAALATWFKKLYPDLSDGVWASSALLEAQTDYKDFYANVGQSIREIGGEQCYNNIKDNFALVEKALKKKPRTEVYTNFNLCDKSIDSDQDVSNFIYHVAGLFVSAVVFGLPSDIEKVCTYFTDSRNDYQNLMNYYFYQYGNDASCLFFNYKEDEWPLLNTTFTDNTLRQWTYQSCTEFGWYTTTDSKKQPFGTLLPLKFFTRKCARLYTNEFTLEFIEKQVQATNERYGGLNPGIENVFYTQGGLDPWRSLGIQQNVIPLEGFSMDLSALDATDSAELRAVKEKISDLISQWIEQ